MGKHAVIDTVIRGSIANLVRHILPNANNDTVTEIAKELVMTPHLPGFFPGFVDAKGCFLHVRADAFGRSVRCRCRRITEHRQAQAA